ncbi:DNA-processing protein DprA [Pelagovum pacificum]|uniref:DNA-protecting protein DprA n=1 Tax=Pelagovum pacificum TaxID=2588711 RepID=A0A5C5GD59_9RHOB|nr:DNA-processing protein DprA [Pelagovum pacificum]QQA44126.1 DNA-protecting protein DprA [Pelagovum pacificum]TNY32745.1 DNA-protecting protein DprA [Pelagovum pacificum]
MTGDEHSSTHPPLPPTTEDDRFDRLRLLRSRRVGPATYWRLLSEHGGASAALDVLPSLAQRAGVNDYSPCSAERARAELEAGRRLGAKLLFRGEAPYPPLLAELEDAPPILWMRGRADLLDRPMLAMVGARNASSLGTRMARGLAGELGAAGYTLVSGLARGIDAIAHDAALPTGTLAVVAGGVDVIYPSENAALHERIATEGVILSEQPIGLAAQARHFPARNRIVSGLCPATIVVEAAARSGSLITARTALDQGREVFAVPGHPLDPRASGCNALLRDGATLVRNGSDVIEALAPPQSRPAQTDMVLEPTEPPRRPLRRVAGLHRRILDRLGAAPVAEDQLIRDLRAPSRDVGSALTELELDGAITRQPGGLLARSM